MNYFISDIHGEYDLLVKLLKRIEFSDDDKLFVLGDMIDKGSGSIRVLKELYSMQNAFCILGNHEYDFLKYFRSIMRDATKDFDLILKRIQGYFPNDDDTLTWEILDWLNDLSAFIKTDTYIGVHAGVPLDFDGRVKPLENADVERLVYDRSFKDKRIVVHDERTILFGHTPTSYLNQTGKIIRYPRENGKGYSRIHIDTGVYLTGILGCYCFDTDKCYYVSKS